MNEHVKSGNSQRGQEFHVSLVHHTMRTNTLYNLEAFRIQENNLFLGQNFLALLVRVRN